MITSLLSIIKGCCPWFYKSSAFVQYHKTIGETQHQSFMRQTIDPPQDRSQNKNKQAINQYRKNQASIPVQQPQKKQQFSMLQEIKSKKDYSHCIALDHPYYELLHPKLLLLPQIFKVDVEAESKIPQNNYNLKIHIKQSEDERTNIFVYTFQFPTTYEFYEEMQNNFELQKNFDSNIDKYQCQDKLDQSTKIVYLAYKKILIVSPRDFAYVRYTFKIDDENWAIATSIPTAQIRPGKQRGRIILTTTRAIQKEGKLYLTVYSQVDMKMPVKASAAKVRGITEIKKYLDKCYGHIEKQKNSII